MTDPAPPVRRRPAARPQAPMAAGTGATAAPATGRAYGGLSQAARQAARRSRLIDTGLAVFGTVGLRGATVRGVCAAAGLTDRYFYESFDSLESLLQAVYDTLAQRLKLRLLALDTQPWPSLAARAAAGYDAWFDALRDPQVARIVLAEVLGVSPAMDALYGRNMAEFADLTAAPMAAALPAGRLAGQRQVLVGHALVGAALQVAKRWVAGGYRQPQAEVVGTCVLVTLGTLRALADEGSAPAGAAPAQRPRGAG